jgi:hypothetical protein
MPEIPGLFNRLDFISFLLPGYVAIVPYLVLFQPSALFAELGVSFDILSAIVFIVAGPALGLTLSQLHRGVLSIFSKVKAKFAGTKQKNGTDYRSEYAEFCIRMTDGERTQLTEVEAYYDFSVSTGLSLCGLSGLGFVTFGFLRFEPYVLLVGGLILIVAGYLERKDSYIPLYLLLRQKYTKPKESMESY